MRNKELIIEHQIELFENLIFDLFDSNKITSSNELMSLDIPRHSYYDHHLNGYQNLETGEIIEIDELYRLFNDYKEMKTYEK